MMNQSTNFSHIYSKLRVFTYLVIIVQLVFSNLLVIFSICYSSAAEIPT